VAKQGLRRPLRDGDVQRIVETATHHGRMDGSIQRRAPIWCARRSYTLPISMGPSNAGIL